MSETRVTRIRREGYKGGFDWSTLQDRREEDLTLQNVPGFERPLAAGPMDQISTQTDELTGRPMTRTALGTDYTIRRSPDQRTARQKAEDWYNDGAELPSRETVVQVAKALPGAMLDSAMSAIDGTGTLGDATSVLPAIGVAGAVRTIPDGAIPIFGGRRAQSFGQELVARRELPTSVGADGKDRFEIDDSMVSLGSFRNLSIIANGNANLPNQPTVLSDVLNHEELFAQYPTLADMPVVLDMSLSRQQTDGYFFPSRGLMAINPRLLNDPDRLKHVLFHEIQHSVQDIEGFDGGTNPKSPNVNQRMYTQEVIAKQDFDADFLAYEDEVKALANVEWDLYFDRFEQTALQGLTDLGLDVTDYQRPRSRPEGIRNQSTLPNLRAQVRTIDDNETRQNSWRLFEVLEDVEQAENSLDPLDRARLMKQAFDSLAVAAANAPKQSGTGLTDSFKSFFTKEPMDPDDYVGMLDPELTLLDEGLPFVPPEAPKWADYAPDDTIRNFIYRSNQGEVEAENTAQRLGLNLVQRRETSPESTEALSREIQWKNSDDHSLIRPRAPR